jgi:hypothetical protein
MSDVLRIRDGSVYIDAVLCERFLHGIQSVAILSEERSVYLIPLRADGSGGYLLKIRNARGDRVVHCAEFMQRLGIRGCNELQRPVTWDSTRHALRFELPVTDPN